MIKITPKNKESYVKKNNIIFGNNQKN